jgi:hypothetical protein
MYRDKEAVSIAVIIFWITDYLRSYGPASQNSDGLIAEPETICVCKMTTVCVTYNTLSLTPPKLRREYERIFQRQKAVSSIIYHQLYSARKISFAHSAKPMPVQTSEMFMSNFPTLGW